MTDRLINKVALITGGASGFGAGIADCFVREGARVMIADRDASAGKAKADALTQAGHEAAFVETDVADVASVKNAVATCVEALGRMDTMVANAGIGQRPCPVEELSDDELTRQFDINVKGVIWCCKEAVSQFRVQGSGNIVATASGIALTPRPKLLAYGAAKGAVVTFCKGLALELASEGIRVNALCPAVGDTPMIAEFMGGELSDAGKAQFRDALPMGRLITPRDVGEAAVFLASDSEAGTITGAAFAVDAGRCV
ncbi:MAG: glucose 1-dehydrogenase [Rhizobiales bacterium]|nr:glucose 1-dehydrogenase [Hyphomicrobiales bacterium]